MITLDQLDEAIDPATGALRLVGIVASLPDSVGPSFSLAAAYVSPAPADIYDWSLTRPTGVLGLGWSLQLLRIVAVQPVNTVDSTVSFYLETGNGVVELLRLGTDADGAETYARFDGAFWKIRFYRTSRRWVLIDENGTRFTFGNASSTDSIETLIAWKHWTGASSVVAGQASIAIAWRLSEIRDLWDNTVDLDYLQVESTVGAGTEVYTQAAYLSMVTGSSGCRIVLEYADKTADEYQPAHTAPNPPNSWQSRFETKYLQQVSVLSPYGNVLERTVFSYALLGSGKTTKRYLTGVQAVSVSGRTTPGAKFVWGTTGSGQDPAYGQITQITTALGGVGNIGYGLVVPALSQRSYVVQPPAGGPFTGPTLTLGEDYAISVWLATSGTQVALMTSTWEGRWVAATLGSISASTSSIVQVVAARESFAVRVAAQLFPYQRDPTMAGAWTGSANPIPIVLTGTETAITACADGAAAVLGLNSLTLTTAIWNGSAWVGRPSQTLQGGGSAPVAAFGGSGKYIAAVAVDSANTAASVYFYLMGVDGMRQWSSSSVALARPSTAIDSLSVQVGPFFAIVCSGGVAGTMRLVTFDLVDWSDGTLRTQRLTQIAIAPSATPPLPAIHGSSVAIGQLLYRFDGGRWTAQDIEQRVPAGAGALTAASPGTDLLVRTFAAASGGGSIFDVYAYDPGAATPGNSWRSVLDGTLPAGAFVARSAITKSQSGNFIVFARPPGQGGTSSPSNAIYYRQPNGQWSHAFDVPALTLAETASLQVVGERYVVYQSGADVLAYPLTNGLVTTAARTVLTSQALLIPNVDPTALLAPAYFVTYAGAWGPSPVFSLHCVTPTGANAGQAVVAVTSVQILRGNTTDATTGYPAVVLTPTYEPGSAIVDVFGRAARFNRVSIAETSVQGGLNNGAVLLEMFNDLTAAEVASLGSPLNPNYPTGANTNAAQFTRLLTGSTYRTTRNPASGSATQASVTVTFLNTTVRHFLTSGSPQGDPVGYCSRAMQSQSTTDGVTTSATTTYNANLLPETATTQRFDGNGNVETLVTTSAYFPDQYGASGPENLLSPMIQTVNTTNGVAVTAQVTTWTSSWGTAKPRWAQNATFAATAATFVAFDAWSGGPVPSGWLGTGTVVARTSRGDETVTTDAIGRPSSSLYDADDVREVAVFGNADATQASYYGFELYERNTVWSYVGSASIQSHVVDDHFHTGSRSLRITPNGAAQTGPMASFLQTSSGDAYLFSCWMLAPVGFTPDPTTARWTLQVYTVAATPQPVGAPVVLAFPAGTGQWQYLQAVVDLSLIRQGASLPSNTPVSVTLLGSDTRAQSVPVFVDELCFRPLVSSFSASVYDLTTGRVSATLGPNGATWRRVYDHAGRTGAIIGPTEKNIQSLSMFAYARAMSAGDAYLPAFPNQSVDVTSASFGLYQDFDSSDSALWTLPANWTIADRQLTFNGASPDPIGSRAELTGFIHGNYAALVRVPAQAGNAPQVSIGTGDVFVSWVPAASNGTWTLRQLVSGTWTTVASSPGVFAEQWLFAVIDNVVFFFVEGAQVFGWRIGAPTQGKLQLASQATVSFEELVVAVDPGIAVTFCDGAGERLATMAMVDSMTVDVNGQLFDAFGRAAYQCKPVQQTLFLGSPALSGGTSSANTGVNEGGLTTYLPSLNGVQMTLAQYTNPAISDAPYVQTVFESAPFGRPIELSAPGRNRAVGSGHTTRVAYGTNVADTWLNRVLASGAPGLAAGSYFRAAITSPDGHLTETVSNASGQIIARALTPAGLSAPAAIESFQYDGAGRQVLHRQPNSYALPLIGSAASWVITATYDFAGNLTSASDPETGTTLFLHDRMGRPRFSMDAAAAALIPPVIRYVRYDALDRIVERGTVSAPSLAWSALAAHVDDQSWPAQADGATWARRYFFDRPPTTDAYAAQPVNAVGLLAQLQVNSSGVASPAAAAIDVYSSTYDLSGNVVRQDSYVAAFDSSTRRSGFAWDNANRAIGVTYPRPLDPGNGQPIGPATNVSYFYDRVGRIAGIGSAPDGTEVLDPSNPNPGPMARYAYYEYQSDGAVRRVTHGLNSGAPVRQAVSYDAAGNVTQLDGDYFTQSFTYGTGGLASSTSWCGRATSAQSCYGSKPGSTSDPATGVMNARTWLYRYDASGRLNGAVASDVALDSSLAAGTASTPIAYDPNGAILTVPRSDATETYNYTATPQAPRTNSRTQQVSVDISVTLNLSAPLPNGWSFGAGNRGPSTSQIVSTGPGAPYIQLGGGSLGHYEYLQYKLALGQWETYTLIFSWQAPVPFGTQPGIASCDLVLTPAEGVPYRMQLLDLSAGAVSWQTATLTLDMAAATAASGLAGRIVFACIQFRNAKRGPNGTSGAPLQIQSLTLARAASSPTPPAYQYDAAGRMTQSPPRSISAIQYDPMSGYPGQLTFASGGPVSSVAFTRGPADAVSTRRITYSDNTTLKILETRAPGGGLLSRETVDPSGTKTQALFLRDASRTFGTLPAAAGEPELYQIRDRLGSLRVVAAAGTGPAAGLRQLIDYGPFGEILLSTGASPSFERFTGQVWEPNSGLGEFGERFYDPQLRAFLQADRARQTGSPYAYAGGDPVNFIDPSGNLLLEAKIALWGSIQVYRGYQLYQSGYLSYIWNNPGAFALDMTEMGTAWLAGRLTLMGLSYFGVINFLLRGNAFHLKTGIPHTVPLVSLTVDMVSSLYSSAWYGAVRTVSERLQGMRETLSAWDVVSSLSSWRSARDALLQSLYRHFLAPPIRFPYRDDHGNWKIIKTPMNVEGQWHVVTKQGKEFFRLSDGTYAFEEYSQGGGVALPFIMSGNSDMPGDTNFALWLSRRGEYDAGLRYTSAAWKAFVLEHRPYPGYFLFLEHAVHTPGRGGPAHIGWSVFSKHGVEFFWLVANEAGRSVDMINARRADIEALIATESAPEGLGADERREL